MDCSIDGDGNATLVEKNSKLTAELETVKQNLYDAERQIKLKDTLISEFKEELSIFQGNESSKNQKYESRIKGLEEALAELRSNHLQQIAYLESEVLKRKKETEDLNIELEALRTTRSREEKCKDSGEEDEMAELLSENIILKEQNNEYQSELRAQIIAGKDSLELQAQNKKQINDLTECLNAEKEKLTEQSLLIEELNYQLCVATTDLKLYKNKPLQDGSKGNSLFAEVDDRRVHLQKTINDMKSSYITLKQEHARHEMKISQLRKENADVRALWRKDLEEIEEDQLEVMDSLTCRIKVLEEMNKKQKQQLDEQLKLQLEEMPKPSNNDLWAEYQFYQDIIKSKSTDIEKLEEQLRHYLLSEHMLSSSLAKARREIKLLKLNVLELKEQIAKNESKDN